MKRMLERIGKEDARCRRLRQIPGFGPLVSTATVAPLVTGRPSAGDATSPLGLVLCHGSTPREASRRNWGILGRFELAMVTKQATATRGEHRGGECSFPCRYRIAVRQNLRPPTICSSRRFSLRNVISATYLTRQLSCSVPVQATRTPSSGAVRAFHSIHSCA
jgi:hypothetical protein